MKSSGKSFQTILVALIALALVSGIFVASNATTTAMDNVVVCVNKKTGTMRLPMKDKCKKKEQKIVLARTGPQGIQGVQGAIGPAGPAGPTGLGGNYLNSQYAIYDAQKKILPFEILSIFGNAVTINFKGFIFTINADHTYPSNAAGPEAIYSDSGCSEVYAEFGYGYGTEKFPQVQLEDRFIRMWASKNTQARLFSWNDMSKYGNLYVKTRKILNVNKLRERLRSMLAFANATWSTDEVNVIVEKFRTFDTEFVGLDRTGQCTELNNYLELAEDNSLSLSLIQHLGGIYFDEGPEHIRRMNIWLKEVIDFAFLQESSSINDFSQIFKWDAFTAYLSANRPDTWDGIQIWKQRIINRKQRVKTAELIFFREYDFRFRYPLTLNNRGR